MGELYINKEVKGDLEECLYKIGIDVEEDGYGNTLSEQITDSLFFVKVVLELELEFDIEIPDEYLSIDLFSSLDHLCEVIIFLRSKNEEGG